MVWIMAVGKKVWDAGYLLAENPTEDYPVGKQILIVDNERNNEYNRKTRSSNA